MKIFRQKLPTLPYHQRTELFVLVATCARQHSMNMKCASCCGIRLSPVLRTSHPPSLQTALQEEAAPSSNIYYNRDLSSWRGRNSGNEVTHCWKCTDSKICHRDLSFKSEYGTHAGGGGAGPII